MFAARYERDLVPGLRQASAEIPADAARSHHRYAHG
jgi:hypothetical protein